MAKIVVETTPEEQEKILATLRELQGKTIAVSAIGRAAGMNPNRVRFIIADLEEAGKIKRVPTKAFNQHYIRYRYEVLA